MKVRDFPMKERQCQQGDVLIEMIDALPDDAKAIANETGRHVIAHSETGHHHAITAPPSVVQLFGSSDPSRFYMRVQKEPVVLEHERPTDTHEAWRFPPAVYEIQRQRESTPEGWERQVED